MHRVCLAILFSMTIIACTAFQADVDVKAVGKDSRASILGATLWDARNNLYLMYSPGIYKVRQQGNKPAALPLILKTKCGNTYYQLVMISNWDEMDDQYDPMMANNYVVFELDDKKEACGQ